MDKKLKKYFFANSILAYSFITILISPMFANKLGLSIYDAGLIFSTVYGVQAILTFLLGHYFEKKSPNYGLALGRTLFALGNIVLAYAFNSFLYLLAQILIGSFEIFSPLLSMYERAIIPPKQRERFYKYLLIISEGIKVILFLPLLFFINYNNTSLSFYRNVFISVFILNIFYTFFILKILPFVKSGSDLHKEHIEIHKPNLRKYLTVLINQIIFFANFGFGSYLIISYYIKETLNGDSKIMIIYEIIFSVTILTSLVWRKFIKLDNKNRLILGTFIMAFFYFALLFKGWITFYLSHVILGTGFVLWFSAKEPLKQEYAPINFGRWEGLFNGLNLFSKIFTPALAGYIAYKYSYNTVFIISFVVLLINSLITYIGLNKT
ncbi:Major Facilitator Superfamily protein [Marinitoga hydrogenitolerans DSM 16785]|uniref:Major Facilitator Superfamily protein n=1 Tax=Marinitoga hydrogenitolerans (strain DSM 16785 / JCM 12826 / AT1271) TaxID=1122195 RepID=A0A1M4SK40_MARH1|nr:MFS transporter [Marinitoga hydrogenitolerans]SHE32561.1 Major Facilitator Superfamily protein [Marinitoga hydrogenitolerans DSM 16785]